MSATVDRELITARLAAVRDGFVVHDATGEVVDANPRFCQMSGYTRAGRPDVTVKITTADAGPYQIEFAVADDGQGIDPQYHEKIFVIFQTLAARDKVEGAGVGLS